MKIQAKIEIPLISKSFLYSWGEKAKPILENLVALGGAEGDSRTHSKRFK